MNFISTKQVTDSETKEPRPYSLRPSPKFVGTMLDSNRVPPSAYLDANAESKLGSPNRFKAASVGGLIISGPSLMCLLCRFSDAGMTRLSTRCGGRRPKSAKARNRGKWGTGGAAGAI